MQVLVTFWSICGYNERRRKNINGAYPPVTLIRPLRGVDSCLEENLRSTFKQEYENLEIILCVDSEEDEAVEVARKIISEYPNVNATLLIGDKKVGVNPKINNLIRGYECAKHELIWIMDSNVIVPKDCLKKSVFQFESPKVAMVHHRILGTNFNSIAAKFEAMYLSLSHMRTYLFINRLAEYLNPLGTNIVCVIGKSTITRKSCIEKLGGLAKFAQYMAEDNALSCALTLQGWECAISTETAYQNLNNMSFHAFASRKIRWTRLRYSLSGIITLFEPVTEFIGSLLLGLFTMGTIFRVSTSNLLVFHFFLWFACDMVSYFSYNSEKVTFTSLSLFPLIWTARELLFFPLYFLGISKDTIEWRGHKFRLKKASLAVPYEEGHVSKALKY
ncbi:nucleotide-diphospho-sugar transferase, partial [Rozella allomycis CSF55]